MDTEEYIETSNISEIKATEEKMDKMEQLILNLSEECQEILRLFYFSRFSLDEIGKKMNYTYEFAKQKKSRCLQKLRGLANAEWPVS